MTKFPMLTSHNYLIGGTDCFGILVNGIKVRRSHSLLNKKIAEGKWVESKALLKY